MILSNRNEYLKICETIIVFYFVFLVVTNYNNPFHGSFSKVILLLTQGSRVSQLSDFMWGLVKENKTVQGTSMYDSRVIFGE